MSEATIPKIAVLLRKVYGGAALGMGILPGFGTDLIFAWPTAEVGAMGAEQAVALFYADEIKMPPIPKISGPEGAGNTEPIMPILWHWHLM